MVILYMLEEMHILKPCPDLNVNVSQKFGLGFPRFTNSSQILVIQEDLN